MTSTNGSSGDRLDRIEQLVESNARVIRALQDQVASTNTTVEALTGRTDEISESLRNLIRMVELNGRYQGSNNFLVGGALEDHEERIRILEAELGIAPRPPEAGGS